MAAQDSDDKDGICFLDIPFHSVYFSVFNPHCLILKSIRAIKYNCIKPQNNNETNKQLDKKITSHHSGAAAGCENHTVPPGCQLDTDSPRPC